MSYADKAGRNTSALLREARAVKRATKAYDGLRRGSASGVSAEAVSKAIVLAYLGGAR